MGNEKNPDFSLHFVNITVHHCLVKKNIIHIVICTQLEMLTPHPKYLIGNQSRKISPKLSGHFWTSQT